MRVLGPQASHLLLIRTNLGYGTVLTAACARQGCSASVLVVFFFTFGSLTDFIDLVTATLFLAPSEVVRARRTNCSDPPRHSELLKHCAFGATGTVAAWSL
jgi:hypothetical protein